MSKKIFDDDQSAMARALELAEQARGYAEPNPMVGAVIVDENRQLLGEGYHQNYGEAHAEVHAIQQANASAQGATMYVTLEPCSHHGKTGPCANAVIDAGIRNVFVAMQDPNEKVNGQGIQLLRDAGIEVEVGLLEAEARELNAAFIKRITTGMPYVHAKWAMTLDGKIATRTGHSMWISNDQSRKIVHQLRGKMDAIIAGIGTVLHDNPQMTARPKGPREPVRIVLDRTAQLPLDSKLVQTAKETPVMLVTSSQINSEKRIALEKAGVEIWSAKQGSHDTTADLNDLLKELGNRKMTNVFIEGGGHVLGTFLDAGLIDETHTFIAPKLVGGRQAISAFGGDGFERIPEIANIKVIETRSIDGDIYLRGRMT